MSPESIIGHYRVTSKLGEGGMGAVYRATDTKLGREVAIKVLPESFAADAERVARFHREAQVLASLNHPNIAAIYGVEDRALVMEMVLGQTLDERIARGGMDAEEALPIARQIAEALEYAHERGVIHRDLKPPNIKVTPEGRVKVLDFGLAKALSTESGLNDPAASATLTMSATTAGMIMGTPAYMSPEQAKGKPVDRRTDIWAFGVILAEMLSGKTVYSGDSVTEILASVLLKEPDLTAVPASTHPAVRRLLRRCLDKDPQRRLRDIGEARVAIEEVLAGTAPVEEGGAIAGAPAAAAAVPVRVKPAGPRGSRVVWMIAGVLAAISLAAGWAAWRATRPVARPVMRFSVDLGPGSIAGAFITAVPSPDGSRIVYPVGSSNAPNRLATRLLDRSKVTVLDGTDYGEQPFFSPDGQWIGFFAGQQLKKVSVHGGAPVVLCNATGLPRGAAWGEDDSIIANIDNRQLFRVPAGGGTPQVVGKPAERGERTWRFPQYVADKKVVVFTGTAAEIGMGFDDANIEVLSLDTGKAKIVQRGGYFGRYLPTGHLIYISRGTLLGVRFDIDRLETRGEPVAILDDPGGVSGQGAGQFAFSNNGTFYYRTRGTDAEAWAWEFNWLDSSGRATAIWKSPASVLSLKLSPDGNRFVGSIAGDIVVFDVQRAAPTRVTFTPNEQKRHCIWSPDGKYVLFTMPASGPGLWWVRADGSSQPRKFGSFPGAKSVSAAAFSPDGRRLAYAQTDANDNHSVWTAPIDLKDPDNPSTGVAELFAADADDAAFSPDGHWLAYSAYAPTGTQIFVRPFPPGPSAGKWQVSASGRFPVWARTGRELFFLSADNHIMAASWEAKGDRFGADPPRRWTPVEVARTGIYINFDVAADGRRVLAFPVHPDPADAGPAHVTVLLNFFDEVKRRLP